MSDAKQELRERIWDDLEDSGEARFPFPPHGRIPHSRSTTGVNRLLGVVGGVGRLAVGVERGQSVSVGVT